MKRFAALILAVVLVMSMGLQAFAKEGSPVDGGGYVDDNSEEHTNKIVVSKISKTDTATVIWVESKKGSEAAEYVTFNKGRNKNGKKVAIVRIGNGERGVFNSAAGRVVTNMTIKSKKKVTVRTNALKGSKIKKIRIQSATTFQTNAFKGTKTKDNVVIKVDGKGSELQSSDIVFQDGAFNGVNTQSWRLYVSKDRMNATQYKKLKNKLKRYGYKGKVLYY